MQKYEIKIGGWIFFKIVGSRWRNLKITNLGKKNDHLIGFTIGPIAILKFKKDH